MNIHPLGCPRCGAPLTELRVGGTATAGPQWPAPRSAPTFGPIRAINGLDVALISADSPVGGVSTAQWSSWSCARITCDGVAV